MNFCALPLTKSSNDGPLFNWSVKCVVLLLLEVDGCVAFTTVWVICLLEIKFTDFCIFTESLVR